METYQHGDQEFALGCLPRSVDPGSVRPCLAEAIVALPQDKWEPCDFSDLVPPATLQGKHGACVGCNAADGIDAAAKIAGNAWRSSGWDLYRMICGGEDRGASIHSALQVLHDRGVCAFDLVPEFTLSSKDTDAMRANAARHQVLESFDCPTRAAIATAMQCRFPTPLGLQVYTNFSQFEEIGGKVCIAKPAGRLRGGHCVLGCGLDYIGGRWRVKVATKSWGLDFGDQGCAWYCLDWLSDSYADAWCIRSVSYAKG